jgi:hypothetical protein
LWSHEDTLNFIFDPKISLSSGFSIKESSEKLKVVRLDDLISFPVDVVKMDVEGCEKYVLRGGQKLFETKPILFIEVNFNACARIGYNALEVIYQILSFGYDHMYMFDSMNLLVEKKLSDFKDILKIKTSFDLICIYNTILINKTP